MANIEQNLRELAIAKGLRLSDIADRMGTTVSNLLTSVKGNPTVSKLEDIADALGVGVSELLTMRPESAQGLIIIGGQTYQISKPSASVVQIPTYSRYDVLRGDVMAFIAKAVEQKETVSLMGIVATLEFFCLAYDTHSDIFHLSLCYGNGRTITLSYDKMEFCDWDKDGSGEGATWNVSQVTEEMIAAIEGAVPSMLRQE